MTVRPLLDWQKDRYCAERRAVDAAASPETYGEIGGLIAETGRSGLISMTDRAASLGTLVRSNNIPGRVAAVWLPALLVVIGSLPHEIRDLYGFPWSAGRRRTLDAATRAIRQVRPLIPRRVRLLRSARRAEQRLRAG
jgi:uncharacterized protein (DUF2236 family)